MRFVESVIVGVPLFWFFFFVVLMATETDKYFLLEEGVPLEGSFMVGFEGVNFGSGEGIKNSTGLGLREEMKTEPFDQTNQSGVFATISVASQGIGFIKNIINLELAILRLPLKNVAGVGTENRSDIIIFNNLFWVFFVLPSHTLMGFALLFFVRSG